MKTYIWRNGKAEPFAMPAGMHEVLIPVEVGPFWYESDPAYCRTVVLSVVLEALFGWLRPAGEKVRYPLPCLAPPRERWVGHFFAVVGNTASQWQGYARLFLPDGERPTEEHERALNELYFKGKL